MHLDDALWLQCVIPGISQVLWTLKLIPITDLLPPPLAAGVFARKEAWNDFKAQYNIAPGRNAKPQSINYIILIIKLPTNQTELILLFKSVFCSDRKTSDVNIISPISII
ncbi:hypothetical protein WN51_07464 [Melipona quadrifasciata]|uniref:Uncharacterized protein n=1 Tax=Melipona quadrifasciata TaxID=166423 RepID=A0A0M9A9C5_9HYME|nr:hypothetical protein WN51_07464 [Melipona quadrifasciata]